ncbi:MAG: hypothetical protein AAGD07_25095 [Planctomycetota bacterium]
MALKTIEQEWQGFARMVIPNAKRGEVMYDEMKKAFFAGAWALRTAMEEIGEPHVSEEEAVEYLEGIADECLAFKSQVMREYGEMN